MTDPFPPRRTFKHHITDRTINRDLNVTTAQIPEYWPPMTQADKDYLSAIVGWCLLVGSGGD